MIIGLVAVGVSLLIFGLPSNTHKEEGQIALKGKKPKRAIEELEKSFSISPSDNTKFMLATAYAMDKQYGKAEKMFFELLQEKPYSAEILYNIAYLNAKKGEKEKANKIAKDIWGRVEGKKMRELIQLIDRK